MAFLLHKTRFFSTVNYLRNLPATLQPEIAFAGRSNVGKSTAINVLRNQKRLAFTSKTPGRTQHINYFSIGSAAKPIAHIVDLPGYGYAIAPKALKAYWHTLLSCYLQTRIQLRGLILMIDARHPLTKLDYQMIEWFSSTGKPIHALLTKCDKLSRQERCNALHVTQKIFGEYHASGYKGKLSAQLFSSLSHIGLKEAHALIENWIAQQETIYLKIP